MTTTSGIAGSLASGPLGNDALESLRSKPVAEVAREFEAMLLAQMIGAMRKTVGESGLLSASPERRMLDGFFDLELARSLVDDMDLGLARQLGAEVERKSGTAGEQGVAPSPPTMGPLPPWQSGGAALAAPVVAPISSGYGQRLDPLTGELDFHAGVDLAAPRGTPVRAAAAGAVVFSGDKGTAGNLVELRHRDGTRTSYAHLENVRVRAGEAVTAGQVLGAVGSTGRTTGPHLHFAVERAGEAVDPAPLLEKRSSS